MDTAIGQQYAPIPDAAYCAPSPCFLFDRDAVATAYAELRHAFPGADIHYALKANPEPVVLAAIADIGCGFEAASYQEIELLLCLGVSPDRIIYGTSVKPRAHVEQAVAAGINRFAADSREELRMLAEAAPGSRVFIRVKVDDAHSVFQMSGKFGADSSDAAGLLRFAADLGLVPWGLSFNVGSQAGKATAWADGLALLRPIVEELLADGLQIECINIGGGFPVPYDNHVGADIGVIARHVADALAHYARAPRLILEPGRRLVATSMSLVASVISRIERCEGTWLFLDCGVYNALFEALPYQGRIRYPVEPLRRSCSKTQPFVLAGPTGDALDVMARDVELPADLNVGDRLLFRNAGAYTLALASTFNGFPKPPILVLERP